MTNANPHKSRKKAMGSIIRVSGVNLIFNIVYVDYTVLLKEKQQNIFILLC
jgi:hypothetical protein